MYKSSEIPLYVIGHKNPDTDAICAAIGYADLLQKKGNANVIPARCGEIPVRTAWVLEQAGMEVPYLLSHVHATAEMICTKDVVKVNEDDTFLSAYHLMVSSGVRSIPVVNAENKFCGLLKYLDLLQLLMPVDADIESVKKVRASPLKVSQTLQAEVEGADLCSEEREIIQLVGASSEQEFTKRIQQAKEKGDVGSYAVICGDRPAIQKMAIDEHVRMLVVTGGFKVAKELADQAKLNGVTILHCKQDTGTVSKLIRCSRMVSEALDQDLVKLYGNETVESLQDRLADLKQNMFPVINPSDETFMGIITQSSLIDPLRIKLILVDHNEFSQAVNGIESADVVEVVDHHRLAGDIVTSQPIRYINEPVGSASTLVAREFRYEGLELSKGVATCLIAGLVTDTLNLTSPTTADLDREILPWLCEIADLDPADFTAKIFESGSLLATCTAEEAIDTDRKIFEENGAKVSISHIEECGLNLFKNRHDDLIVELERMVEAEGYDLNLLIVTDITSHHSVLLARGNEGIIKALPYERGDDGIFQGPGVVSRKKQVFPAVCQALRKYA